MRNRQLRRQTAFAYCRQLACCVKVTRASCLFICWFENLKHARQMAAQGTLSTGLLSALLGSLVPPWAKSAEPRTVEGCIQEDKAVETEKEAQVQQKLHPCGDGSSSMKKPRLAAEVELKVPMYVADLGVLDLPVSRPKDQDDHRNAGNDLGLQAAEPGSQEAAGEEHSSSRSLRVCAEDDTLSAARESPSHIDAGQCSGGSDIQDQQESSLDGSPTGVSSLSTPTGSAANQCFTPPRQQLGRCCSTPLPCSGPDPPEHTISLSAEADALSRCLGASELQGGRPYQEDRTNFILRDNIIHIGLYDGHAGQHTSSFLQTYLLRTVCQKMQEGLSAPMALHDSFTLANSHLRGIHTSFYCGSTATVVIIDGQRLVCANAGDSPAFVVDSNGGATCLTMEHNPNTNESERLRVQAAGGRIEKMHWGERHKRVLSYDSLSGLAMTRAFGDFNFTGVICDPHISNCDIADDARYLVVASDGLTEQWTIDGAADAVMQLANAGFTPADIALRLSYRATELGSRDNVSVVILDLQQYLRVCATFDTSSLPYDTACNKQ